MKSKSRKSEELAILKKKLPESKITVFTSFSKIDEKGLSVAQMTELKRALRTLGAEYFVTKKTLIDLAVRGKQYDGLDVFKMSGSIGLVLGGDDPYVVAKKVYEFSKKNPSLRLLGALIYDKFLGSDPFMEIAKLPSKEVLIGRLVGMLTYPIRGLAIVLKMCKKSPYSAEIA